MPYYRWNIKVDTSKRNCQVRGFKRSILVSIIYMHGRIDNDHVDLLSDDAEHMGYLMQKLRDNNWVGCKAISGGLRIWPGEARKSFVSLLQKMQLGRDKNLSLQKVFNFIYAPNFMRSLEYHYGISSDDTSEIAYDLSWAFQPDLVEYPKWLEVWGVRARVEGSILYCNKEDIEKLKKEVV